MESANDSMLLKKHRKGYANIDKLQEIKRLQKLIESKIIGQEKIDTANQFQVYIVSGGGIDFMRSFIPEIYGIPKNHIIGSTGKVHYKDGQIIKDAAINFIDDKETKPVAIYYNIGKRPVATFGNSDGDLAMMQYTEANKKYKTLELYVHHTDNKREWKYDRKSHIGRLDKGLDYAKKHNWVVVDMKKDWRLIYLKKH